MCRSTIEKLQVEDIEENTTEDQIVEELRAFGRDVNQIFQLTFGKIIQQMESRGRITQRSRTLEKPKTSIRNQGGDLPSAHNRSKQLRKVSESGQSQGERKSGDENPKTDNQQYTVVTEKKQANGKSKIQLPKEKSMDEEMKVKISGSQKNQRTQQTKQIQRATGLIQKASEGKLEAQKQNNDARHKSSSHQVRIQKASSLIQKGREGKHVTDQRVNHARSKSNNQQIYNTLISSQKAFSQFLGGNAGGSNSPSKSKDITFRTENRQSVHYDCQNSLNRQPKQTRPKVNAAKRINTLNLRPHSKPHRCNCILQIDWLKFKQLQNQQEKQIRQLKARASKMEKHIALIEKSYPTRTEVRKIINNHLHKM